MSNNLVGLRDNHTYLSTSGVVTGHAEPGPSRPGRNSRADTRTRLRGSPRRPRRRGHKATLALPHPAKRPRQHRQAASRCWWPVVRYPPPAGTQPIRGSRARQTRWSKDTAAFVSGWQRTGLRLRRVDRRGWWCASSSERQGTRSAVASWEYGVGVTSGSSAAVRMLAQAALRRRTLRHVFRHPQENLELSPQSDWAGGLCVRPGSAWPSGSSSLTAHAEAHYPSADSGFRLNDQRPRVGAASRPRLLPDGSGLVSPGRAARSRLDERSQPSPSGLVIAQEWV